MRASPKGGTLLLILCMAALCLLSGPAAAETAEEDPVIVRVQDVVYTRSQIQPAMEANVNLARVMTGTYLTEEERETRQKETIDRYVAAALIQVKLKEAGLNDFTPEEEETLKSAARNQYEQIWQGIWQKARESGEEFTEEQVTEFMEDSGYTISGIYEEMKAYERRRRAAEKYCPGLILTQEMISAYYEENFLKPDRERYENDLDLYEAEIIARKNESFYTPPGYRAIKQVLLKYPAEVDRALKNERARFNIAANTAAQAMQALAMAAASAEGWEDMREPRAAYEQALEELNAARADYAEKRKAKSLPLIQPTVDAILAEFRAGADFDSLIRKYSSDTNEVNLTGGGYPFHAESKNWTEEFSAAAAALQKPGDVSQAVFSDLGIHILYYASDIPAGEHALTEDEQETLTASALDYYQDAELAKLIEEWMGDYPVETYPERMNAGS